MIKIFIREGEPIEKALRILKKKTAEMLREYRERQYYKKPSQIRRERDQASRRKRKKRK